MNTQRDDNANARLKRILRHFYDTAKVHLKQILRGIGKQLRIVGPPIFAWLMKHKASVAIVLLVLYILFIPRRSPDRKVSDAQPLAITTTPPSATPTTRVTDPTTQATTEPVAVQSVGDIQLYAPDRPGFEPQWGLPAPLKAAELQAFALQVQKLTDDTIQTMTLEGKYNGLLAELIDEKIANIYWQRLLGHGFLDKSLPLDWYDVVKDRNGILASAAAFVELMANGNAQAVILARIGTIRVRIVGGKVIIADQLFINGLKPYIDQRLAYLQKMVPLAQDVANRTGKEFQKELAR